MRRAIYGNAALIHIKKKLTKTTLNMQTQLLCTTVQQKQQHANAALNRIKY